MGIDTALHNESLAVPLLQNVFPLIKMPKLKDVPLDKTISEEEYKLQLRLLQEKLGHLHNRLYRKRVPVVIVYEGWDAAGKGGNIKRLASALDPRGYEVIPIAAPPTTSWPGITCGGSGSACQRRATSPSLTAAGTGG